MDASSQRSFNPDMIQIACDLRGEPLPEKFPESLGELRALAQRLGFPVSFFQRKGRYEKGIGFMCSVNEGFDED